MNILILMAGSAEDFEEKGYSYPKYLIEVQKINRLSKEPLRLLKMSGIKSPVLFAKKIKKNIF